MYETSGLGQTCPITFKGVQTHTEYLSGIGDTPQPQLVEQFKSLVREAVIRDLRAEAPPANGLTGMTQEEFDRLLPEAVIQGMNYPETYYNIDGLTEGMGELGFSLKKMVSSFKKVTKKIGQELVKPAKKITHALVKVTPLPKSVKKKLDKVVDKVSENAAKVTTAVARVAAVAAAVYYGGPLLAAGAAKLGVGKLVGSALVKAVASKLAPKPSTGTPQGGDYGPPPPTGNIYDPEMGDYATQAALQTLKEQGINLESPEAQQMLRGEIDRQRALIAAQSAEKKPTGAAPVAIGASILALLAFLL